MEFRLPSNKVLCIWHDSSKTVQEEEELNRLAGKWDFIYWLPAGVSGFLTWRVLGKKVVVAVTTQLHPQVEIREGCGKRQWLADRSEGLGEKKREIWGYVNRFLFLSFAWFLTLKLKKDSIWKNCSLLHYVITKLSSDTRRRQSRASIYCFIQMMWSQYDSASRPGFPQKIHMSSFKQESLGGSLCQ